MQSWNMTVERELGHGLVVEVGYSGSKGTHLGRKYDINQEIRTPTDVLPNGLYPRPFPGFTAIEYSSFGFNSSYQAGTVTVRKSVNRFMFFRANYTYGKSIDDNSGLNYAGNGGYQGAQNSMDTLAERGDRKSTRLNSSHLGI